MKFPVMRMRNWNRELTLEQGTNVDQKNHKNTDFRKGPTQYQHVYEKLEFLAKSY